MAVSWLKTKQSLDKANAEEFKRWEGLYSKKLWHELTDSVVSFVTNVPAPHGLPDLYESFVSHFASKANLLSVAQIAVTASTQVPVKERSAFLKQVLDKVEVNSQAVLLISVQLADVELQNQHFPACKDALDAAFTKMEAMAGVPNVISASYYKTLADLELAKGNPPGYYAAALQYLSYAELGNLTDVEQTELARRICLMALIAPRVYNFQEVLSHPIINALKNTPHAWLADALAIFNSGDLVKYDSLKPKLTATPETKAAADLLLEKISILALMELVFHRPSQERQLPFALIAEKTKHKPDQVEHLIMKALSLDLIRGSIDQVDQVVTITWVQPRVLGLNQVATLQTRLATWIGSVAETSSFLETGAQDFLTA